MWNVIVYIIAIGERNNVHDLQQLAVENHHHPRGKQFVLSERIHTHTHRRPFSCYCRLYIISFSRKNCKIAHTCVEQKQYLSATNLSTDAQKFSQKYQRLISDRLTWARDNNAWHFYSSVSRKLHVVSQSNLRRGILDLMQRYERNMYASSMWDASCPLALSFTVPVPLLWYFFFPSSPRCLFPSASLFLSISICSFSS